MHVQECGSRMYNSHLEAHVEYIQCGHLATQLEIAPSVHVYCKQAVPAMLKVS